MLPDRDFATSQARNSATPDQIANPLIAFNIYERHQSAGRVLFKSKREVRRTVSKLTGRP